MKKAMSINFKPRLEGKVCIVTGSGMHDDLIGRGMATAVSLSLNPEPMYMLPIHFGPMCGSRQGPGGKKFAFNPDKRKIAHLSVSF